MMILIIVQTFLLGLLTGLFIGRLLLDRVIKNIKQEIRHIYDTTRKS